MKASSPRPYTFDRVVRIIVIVVAIIGAFYIIKTLKGALLPFAVAWLIAYLLNPIVNFLQTRCRIRNRVLAIITTISSITAVITALGWLLIPSIVSEAKKTSLIIKNISSAAIPSQTQPWYQTLVERIDLDKVGQFMNRDDWASIIENSFSHIWSLLTGSISQLFSIISWFIVLLYLIFILLDFDKIVSGFKSLIPTQYRETTLSILADVEQGMNRYFRGQSLIALTVGILFSIGFVIVGLPLAIPLGLFIGVLNLVPYLQIVGIIPTLILCFLGTYDSGNSFWTLVLLSTIVFAVVQSIQDIYITPRIMGKATGLNPAVILLSLSVWGTLLGMLGMIIALPMTSILLAYYQKYIIKETTSPADN